MKRLSDIESDFEDTSSSSSDEEFDVLGKDELVLLTGS
jgi:hypothetical protein